MMGAGANGAASRQDEIGQLMGVLATKAARDLALDLKVRTDPGSKKRPRFLVPAQATRSTGWPLWKRNSLSGLLISSASLARTTSIARSTSASSPYW